MSNHIYVVDDDAALGRLSARVLQSEGFQVQSFTSSLEALSKIADSSIPNPAAIVLDLNMPEMDGRQFYRMAREAGYASPVLILSAYGAQAAQEELGAEAALAKPFDPDSLTTILKGLLPEQGSPSHSASSQEERT